ncbi:MAG: methyl-accepting chemotaxis protein, partial [Bacteroidales bacterium]|nr:methyl-accepting chemotaxis protein [Bacteroidales bacterium]
TVRRWFRFNHFGSYTRGITKPLKLSVDFANLISEGNLTSELKIDQKDEVGTLGVALNNMVNKLRIIVNNIISGAENISSAATQISSTSEQLSQASNEQASSVEEISSTIEETSANIQQNSDNAQQTEKNFYGSR